MLDLYMKLSMLRALASERFRREDGGVVIEYGIVVAVIALGLVLVGLALVGAVGEWFQTIADYVSGLGAPETG